MHARVTGAMRCARVLGLRLRAPGSRLAAWRLHDCTGARSTGSSCPSRAPSSTRSSFPTARGRSCTAARATLEHTGDRRRSHRGGVLVHRGDRRDRPVRRLSDGDSTPAGAEPLGRGRAASSTSTTRHAAARLDGRARRRLGRRRPSVRELDARYLDTADLALARAGFALRRRTRRTRRGLAHQGPARRDGGRVELHWPLGDGPTDAVPPARSPSSRR